MTIAVTMTAPTNGARQVPVATSVHLHIDGYASSGHTPSIPSLGVQLNGVSAIYQGQFQILEEFLAVNVTSPTRFITLANPSQLHLGESVQIFDNLSTIVVYTIVLSVSGRVVELENAVDHLSISQNARIESITRGYTGSISPSIGGGTDVVINPRQPFLNNSVVIATVDLTSTNPFPTGADLVRASFAFRTADTLAPQLVNFPFSINFSNLAFNIVDVLGNGIRSINVSFGSEQAIIDGYLTSDFMGSVTSIDSYATDVNIYLRPKIPLLDRESVPVQIDVADGYGNSASYLKTIINHAPTPRIEFLDSIPADQSVIDPQDMSFTIQLTSTELILPQFVNLDVFIDGVKYSIIRAGRFQTCAECNPAQAYTGTIRLAPTLLVQLDSLLVASALKSYNKSIVFDFYLLEASPLGDVPPGASPLYEKAITYSSISSTIAPFIDTFAPTGVLIPATTQISFRAISRAPGVPLDSTSLIVSVAAVLAIDSGLFRSGFTGSISAVQGSAGHSITVIVIPSTPLTVGASIAVEITIADVSGNPTTSIFTFTVSNTNVPLVVITPPGGQYTKLTRLKLTSTEPAQIYYTIDGSNPTPGQLTTFSATSPITNVPIFAAGITQVKAFAVGTTGVSGPISVELYDLNPFVPQIVIDSPISGALIDQGTVVIHYTITLQRGYLVKTETMLNGSFRQDTQNTLLSSSVTIAGLLSGSNTIRILATDNAGNTGTATIAVNVRPSQLSGFSISYAPLACPKFVPKLVRDDRVLTDTLDTGTVVIIGLGSRLETVVQFALGDGVDGSPVDFSTNNKPDSRHFELLAFPVQASSVKAFLYRKGRTFQLNTTEFVLDPSSGEIVLDHPLERGEGLTVQYIAESDINAPRLFLANQQRALFIRYGQPSTENTLSLGAQMAFENGALRVLAVQAQDLGIDSLWTNSFKILEQTEAYWLVPVLNNSQLSYYPGIRLAAHQHATRMSSVKYRGERIVCGWRMPTEFDSSGRFLNQFQTERIFLIDIDQAPRVTRVSFGTAMELNGTFIAAAIAGLGSGLAPIALPLTSNVVSGFTLGTTQRSPKIDLDNLVGQGFMPVQALAAGASIYRGRSAYVGTGDPVREELSVERSLDYISKNLRSNLQNQFVGKPITDELLKQMITQTNVFLASHLDIISAGSVSDISVDQREPRQVNVKVTINPLYPLNELSISIDLRMTL